MYKILIKVIPTLLFWGVFAYVVLNVSYPESLVSANWQQILLFFTPLLLAFIFTIEIFLKNVFMSFSVSLGLIFLLILKSLESLNLVTVTLVIVSVGLLVSYFRKNKKRSTSAGSVFKNLTKFPKIPKLIHLRRKAKN